VPLRRAGDAAGEKGFVQMCHFNELVFDVRGFGRAVVIGRQCRRADQHVAHADLAAAVALTMVAGKALHQESAEFIFPAHEDIFPGNE